MSSQNPTRLAKLLLGRLHSVLAVGVLIGLTASAAQAAWFDENEIRGYDEFQGAYAQFGVSVGQVNFDDIGAVDVDAEASGGFHISGGYRFNGWIAADANFSYLGGNDNIEIGNSDADTEFWAFSFGAKAYPLGLFQTEAIPHFVQPYGLIAIGGGRGEIDGAGFHEEDDAFVGRFIVGVDIWATDDVGFFVEGGGYAIDDDDIDGAGIFTVGAQVRF